MRQRADQLGQAAVLFGMVAVVGGAVIALAGWHGATLVSSSGDPAAQLDGLLWWTTVGTWLTVGGVAALVLGLVAVIVSRLR